MASDIVAAVDETALNMLLHTAESALGTQSDSGNGSLGPLVADWDASASLSGGTVALSAPDTVAIDDIHLNYGLSLSVGIDLSFLDFCIPRVCIPTPFGKLCTPKICIDFPTISVPVSFSSSATISADFGIDVHLTAGDWFVDIVIQSVPTIDLGLAATLLLTAIGAAISEALAAVPLIGPLVSAATAAVTALFGLAEVTGLLGKIVSIFVSGLTFNVYHQPQHLQVIPATPPLEPAVFFFLANVTAGVQSTTKNELVLSVDL
jgi:hypothetical protein